MGLWLIFLCTLMWGISSFLNRLSVERISPLLLQSIVGMAYVFFIPIALRMAGVSNPLNYKWSYYSVALTITATILSIGANIILYMNIKGNVNSGSSTMLIALYPLVTLLLSALFLNEQFTMLKIIGMVTMVIGAVLLSWK